MLPFVLLVMSWCYWAENMSSTLTSALFTFPGITDAGTKKSWSCWEKPEPTSPGTSWRTPELNCASKTHRHQNTSNDSNTDSQKYLPGSAVHSDPSYIADWGTTSRPTLTWAAGMFPGSIVSDPLHISAVGKYTTVAGLCCLSARDARWELLDLFQLGVSESRLAPGTTGMAGGVWLKYNK